MDRELLYRMIYALAACGGREEALFGTSAPLMAEAFSRSLAGEGYFPELWFELPLLGEPWCDFHALVTAGSLDAGAAFTPETCGNCPDAFAWFAARGTDGGVRQLALSWDTGAGEIGDAAVQLLTGTDNPDTTCGFLEAAGRADAAPAYRGFSACLPAGWFAAYAGVFPQRTAPFLRVECIPTHKLQQAYAKDMDLLETHLRQAGFTAIDDTLLARCQVLADSPFRIEFQFDIAPDGVPTSTLGVSLRFGQPSGDDKPPSFNEADELMRKVEAWGLADGRWCLLNDATFSKRLSFKDASSKIWCFPAFIKLRWRDGAPYDAKAYLMAGVQ